jgi:hypothetical protein
MATQQQIEALRRLWKVANGHSGQCKYVAAFLLGLYNGQRYPFDMTCLRGLDQAIFEDCLTVLRMDYTPTAEVHVLLGVPSAQFEQLAKDWRIRARRVS